MVFITLKKAYDRVSREVKENVMGFKKESII